MTSQVEGLILHLASEDSAKRRVALGVLLGIFKQKNSASPPPHLLRALLFCLCKPDTETETIQLMEIIFHLWPSLGSSFISENMGLAVLWLFVSTYPSEMLSKRADDILTRIEERNIIVVESDVTSAFVEIMKESGRRWIEHGVNVLAHQILTLTTPKLNPQAQKIIEKEIYTVPILVFFLTHLNNPLSLTPDAVLPARLLEVVKDNGIPFMTQAFSKNTDPDTKSSALQGLRAFSNLNNEFEISFFDEIVKCITSPNRILQQEALVFANEYLPESYGKNIEFENYVEALLTGGEDAASYMEFVTRKERQAARFAKSAHCVSVLVKSTEAACVDKQPIEETCYLSLMKNIAFTEIGARSMVNEGAVPILYKIANDSKHSFLNRAYALEVLDSLGEDIEEFFEQHKDFVSDCRSTWHHWVNILAALPARHSVTFVQSSSDVESLYKFIIPNHQKTNIHSMDAVQVIVNVLSNLFSRPIDSKPTVFKQLSLVTHHELVPTAVQNLIETHQLNDKSAVNSQLTCYALLSISNNGVREHVVEENNTPLLLSLLQNTTIVPIHMESVMKALVLVAFCSCGEFVRHGGVDAFLKLLKQQKFLSSVIVGLWLVASDPEFHPLMSGVNETLKTMISSPGLAGVNDYASQILQQLKNTKEVKAKAKSKKKAKSNANEKISLDTTRPKYQSIESKLSAFCSHILTSMAKLHESSVQEVIQLCYEIKLMTHFIHRHTVEKFPENKQMIDFFWMCFNFHNLSISTVAISSFLFLLSHWMMLDSKSPNKYTKALLFSIPKFEIDFNDDNFNKEVAEVLLWINKIEPKLEGANIDDEMARQIDVLTVKLHQQQEAFSESTTKHIAQIAELRQSVQIQGETNDKLRNNISILEEKNSNLEVKAKQLYELHTAKDVVIEEIKHKCQQLEDLRNTQPTDEKIMEYFHNSTIDPINLLNIEGLESLDEIEQFKLKLKEQSKKLKERKEAIKKSKQDAYTQKLKHKDQQIEEYREIVLCPICMDKSKDTIFVPCGHAFCAKCASTILNSNSGRCPVCRINVDSHHLFYL